AYDVAEQTVARDKSLLSQGYIAQSQYDADSSSAVAAESALKSAQAAAAQARAQAAASASQAQAGAAQAAQSVAQAAGSADTAQAQQAAVQIAQAQVQQDRLNLDRSVITSPVDGTVIARNVSVGQTVAASFQTPTLFTIAQDLKKMEVDISVGEPDIGNVRAGDAVSFNVLAYPSRTFNGKVEQVRVNPTTVNNVVTYDVNVLVDNPGDLLLPGMTANAAINVATAHNALVVPTQALAFRPSSAGGHHYHGAHAGGASSGANAASATSPWGTTNAGASANVAAGNGGMLFVHENGKIRPVRVKIDLISGTQAAVTALRGSLSAGDQVVIGNASVQSSARGTSGTGAQPGGPMGGIGRALR
ncbi:MAG: efflux RND transporter periplasmic adaptor subunit, partial [Candidatus Eremiobacteraeota bacterium]|nr:efflux RND transporter periplasmic adaptor subunit [Candidatus Eremiobacteraeota bacterium]